MLLLDVSNIMYTGASARHTYFGEASEFKLRSIPYFLQKVASYYSKDKKMIAVFEKVGKMPALSTSTGYKGGRQRNPSVEWEISALKSILEYIGFPILYKEGHEADHVIANYCRLNGDKENIYILSADQDLASNVKAGGYVTEMLSYSVVSYNINKSNFKEITGVDYNFMNIHKILLGCSSDNIKAFPQGREIYNSFYSNLESLWRRKYGYKADQHKSSDFLDEIIRPYSTYEYFLDWYKQSRYYDQASERELENRRKLIEGAIFDLPPVVDNDWVSFNNLVTALNLNTTCEIKAEMKGKYLEEIYRHVTSLLRQAQNKTIDMFEGASEELDDLEEVGDINNILGILGPGGAL